MGKRDRKYFLAESQGHLYCVAADDLLVADPKCVQVNDEVNFKYGVTSYSGNILKIADKEATILEEMKIIKHAKKVPKRESSFHAEQPRRAAVKQKEKMKVLAAKQSKPSASETSLKKVKARAAKKKLAEDRATAAAAMEDQVVDPESKVTPKQRTTEDGSQSDISDEDESSQHNGSSSDESSCSGQPNKSLQSKGKASDIQKLRALESLNLDEQTEESEGEKERKECVNQNDNAQISEPKEGRIANDKEDEKSKCESPTSSEVINLDDETRSEVNEAGEKNSLDRERQDSTENESSDETLKKKKKKNKKRKERDSPNSGDDNNNKEKRIKLKEKVVEKDEEKKEKSRETANGSLSDDVSAPKVKISKLEEKVMPKDEAEGESSDSLSSDEKAKKEKKRKHVRKADKKKKKKKEGTKRNMSIYDGPNFLYTKDSSNVEKLHNEYEVYVKKRDLTAGSKLNTQTKFVIYMVDKIFTKEALLAATPQGYPPRSKGKRAYKGKQCPPMLDPAGINAIIAYVEDKEVTNKAWRPRANQRVLKSCFSNTVCRIKAANKPKSSSDSGSSSDSSSSESSS